MPSWPSVIEDSKILYIPSTGKGAGYINKNAASLDDVSLESADFVINIGETVGGMTVWLTYYNNTEYYMVLNVTGTGGGEAPSQHPFASFTYMPEFPVVNQTITFNASSSFDPDGNMTSYEWNFGDGNITNTTILIITHSYELAGNYNVTLIVTDNTSVANSTSRLIYVSPLGVKINITVTPIIGVTTKDILKVEYTGFSLGDPYNISITAPNGTRVYYESGNLTGANPEIIPISWTPSITGNHTIEAWGRGMIDSTPLYIYDSAVVSPIPEAATIVLVTAGMMGLVIWRYRKR